MEKLNEALAVLINTALTGLDTSTEFLQAQIPEIVVQLLLWNGTKAGLLSVFGLVFLIVGVVLFVKGVNNANKHSTTIHDLKWALGMLFSLVGFLMFLNFFTLIQIWIAPKVWLIEYAANLVK